MRAIATLWTSAAFLDWLACALHLSAGRALWWRQHGARLVDSLLISGGALLLVAVAIVAWRLSLRRPSSDRGLSPYRRWVSLVVVAFGGSALLFIAASRPDKVANTRRLIPLLAALSRPIYADQATAGDLSYLLRYQQDGIVDAGSLDNATVTAILAARKGCIVVNEPELDVLAGDGLRVSPLTYALPRRQPRGWALMTSFEAADNPLERVAIVCARGRPSSSSIRPRNARRGRLLT